MDNPEIHASRFEDILVVEDNLSSLRMLTDLLKGAGYQVRPATDGELALRSIQAEAPALILLDILLPVLDGYEVCRRLKESESTREIPVIFISAMANSIDQVKAFGVGGVDYITKPIQPDEVLARVRTHLSIRMMHQRLEKQYLELREARDKLEERVQRRTQDLSESEERFRSVTEAASEAIIVTDQEGLVVSWNPGATEMFGRDEEEMLGKNLAAIIPDYSLTDRTPTAKQLNSGKRICPGQRRTELEGLRKVGERFPMELSQAAWTSNGRPFYSDIIRDISERREAEKVIRHLAHHDVLTDLPNRALFMDRLTQALAKAKRDDAKLALLFIDLDKFKHINDDFGHAAGDEVLKQVARRLRSCIRETDPVGRLGGDEFTVCLTGATHGDVATQMAEKIIATLSEPYEVGGRELTIGASIGTAVYPNAGTTAEDLINRADRAMFDAKRGGGSRCRLAAAVGASGAS